MRNHMLLSPSRIRVILAALLVVACDTGTVGFAGPNGRTGGPTGPDSTAGLTLTINPDPIRISVGKTGQFTSRLQDALGNVIAGAVTWASNNPAIATINASGLATGVSAGTTTITASEQGLTTSADVEVDPVPVASVAVAPRLDTLQVGTQVTLAAVTKDAVGNTLTGRQITWTSRSPSIATVDAFGTVTAVAVGVDSVLATSEGVTGAAVITVVNIPVASVAVAPTPDTIFQAGTVQLTATPKDGGGNPLVRAVTWSSGSTAIATVNSAGLVTGAGVGTTTITATSGGVPGTATVTVILAPVATVTVTPKTPSVQVGGTVQLTATTRDAKGNTLTGRVVTWGSNSGNATVNGSGLVTGVTAGSATITATSETINGTATAAVTVPPPSLVRIIMSPDTATINTGTTKQFATVGKYSDSSTAAVTPTYTATGGTVTASGLYTAGGTAGTFRVIATASGFADTSTLTVVKVPVAQVIVTPNPDTIPAGTVRQLAATTKDAGGNVLTGRVVTWGSSNTAVATVSASGAVTAVAVGSATITATSETISGTATTVVTVVLAATVSLAPSGASVVQGNSVTLTATARDKSGNILSGHPVTWSSLSGTIASVNGSGSVTGLTVGTATIKASVDTASATTTVRVDSLSSATPWLLEDYSSYTSTTQLMNDPRGIYSVTEDETPGQIFLDTSVGYGGSKNSMRYDFPTRTGQCTDYGIGRNLKLPSDASEVWLEVIVKFSSTWTNTNPGCSGISNEDYKFVFGRVYTSGRFNVMVGTYNSEYTVGYPGGEDNFEGGNIGNDWDGNWHVYRFHMKIGTNGACQLWVDGVLVKDYGTVNAGPNSIYGIALGRNINQGPPAPQSIWWGRVAVYNTNPGW